MSLQQKGSVEKDEEARVYVRDLDLYVTVRLLEDTPPVLSLGQLYEDDGYFYEWIEGQKPNLILNVRNNPSNTDNYSPKVVPGLSRSFEFQFGTNAD